MTFTVKHRAIFTMVVAALMFSTGGVLIKLSGWNGVALNGARSFVSALLIGVYLFYQEPDAIAPLFKERRVSRLQIGGAVAYVATNLTFALATQMTTAANAVLLQFTSPIWVAILGIWLLRERPKWVDWVALVLIFIGMLLFFDGSLSAENLQGNLIAIFSGVTLALMVILLRMEKDGSPATVTFLGNVFAALIGLPFIFGEPFTAYEIAVIVALGIFQLGIPMILYTLAVKHLLAIEAILLLTLEPILNPIWVVLVIAEVPSPQAMIGGVIVIVVVTLKAVVTSIEAH
ncbi:MAG: DMT family transporter [Candidatus Promineifilaceae bacterium]